MPANLLDYITIKGFKSIKSIERLKLRPINLLIGANGSGKSNFLAVFDFLRAYRDEQLNEYVMRADGAERLLYFGSKTTRAITVGLAYSDGPSDAELTFTPTDKDGLRVTRHSATFSPSPEFPERPWGSRSEEDAVNDKASQKVLKPDVLASIVGKLFQWRMYHLNDTSSSSPMTKTAQVDDNRFLRADGSNLASYLYLLQETNRAAYGLIRDIVQCVAPFFDDFQLAPLRLNPNTIRLEWRHRNSDQYFDASSFSDGTLRFIALSTLLLQPAELRPSLILIDEPELGLHPAAITILASLIKQASTDTQVIVSTQSSLLIDHFEPDDVLVAERVNGGTQLRRLEKDKLSAWLEDYSLGQLWEKNEIGGRPGRD
jgi:predicted ATPase